MRHIEIIREYNSSPTFLNKNASLIKAKVGLEMEMGVPITFTEAHEIDDYSYDSKVEYFDDIYNFFEDVNSRNDMFFLKKNMEKEYESLKEEKKFVDIITTALEAFQLCGRRRKKGQN